MNILIDIGHPAHVHLFKNFIFYLKNNGHDVTVVSRNKDIANKLLEHYKIPFISLSKPSKNKPGMVLELIQRDLKVFALHLKKKFDAGFGTSVSIAHLTALFGVPSFCFSDDDDFVIPLYTNITYPFATKIINPVGLKHKRWKDKRVFYNSYQKLSYLHPNNFKPERNVLSKYNLEPRKYILVRKSALLAHHDTGAKGLDAEVWNKIEKVVAGYRIIFSEENSKTLQIEPWDMHHIMAYAKLLITDSQSMAAESAILGTPAVRYSSFVGKLMYLEELDKKYSLLYGFKIGEEGLMIDKIINLINNPKLETTMGKRRENMLHDKIDFNDWVVKFFEKSVLNLKIKK